MCVSGVIVSGSLLAGWLVDPVVEGEVVFGLRLLSCDGTWGGWLGGWMDVGGSWSFQDGGLVALSLSLYTSGNLDVKKTLACYAVIHT